jgi:protein SCO1/2
MLRILIVGLVLLVVVLFAVPRRGFETPPPAVATILPAPRPLPATTFVDGNAATFTTADLAGRFTLMFFGFTNCPDICPLGLQVLAQATAELRISAPESAPRVVFISVDAYRDTPERIRAYLANFDPAFIGLTATDETLAPLLGMMGVTVHKNETEGEYYNVVHNGTVYVLDEAGQWIALFGGSSHDPATIASDYRRIVARQRTHSAAADTLAATGGSSLQ